MKRPALPSTFMFTTPVDTTRKSVAQSKQDRMLGARQYLFHYDDPSCALCRCRCVLAEMCAGEPVLAEPSFSLKRTGSGGGGGAGRDSWLEVAVELPPALRSTIRALTQPDPSKVMR